MRVNRGAAEALLSPVGTNLLMVGVDAVEGDFEKDDIVQVIDPEGNVIAWGRAGLDSVRTRCYRWPRQSSAHPLRLPVHRLFGEVALPPLRRMSHTLRDVTSFLKITHTISISIVSIFIYYRKLFRRTLLMAMVLLAGASTAGARDKMTGVNGIRFGWKYDKCVEALATLSAPSPPTP